MAESRIHGRASGLTISELLDYRGFIESLWDWPVAPHIQRVILFGMLPLITWVLAGFVRMSHRAGVNRTERMKSLIGRFTDALRSIKPIKAMAREEELSRFLVHTTQDINRAQMRHVLASGTLKTSPTSSISRL